MWKRVAIDLIGPMPRNDQEFNYILVIVDAASRFVVIEPIEDKLAVSVGSYRTLPCLCFNGNPSNNPISQCGQEFNNSVIELIKKMFHIKEIFLDQFNHTVVELLSTLAD